MGLNRFAQTWLARPVALVGTSVAWLSLLIVVSAFSIVVLRYAFNLGWIAAQESVSYLHAAVFMLAAAWALQEDGHVRVDIFYREASPRHKAMVNIAGTLLFLLPFCLYMMIVSWDYVAASWRMLEGSREAGGIHGVFLLKSLLLALPVLLLMQGVCNLVSDLRVVRSRPGD